MKYCMKPIFVEAVPLLWSTWSEMCAHVGVGAISEGKPQGCAVDNNGKVLDVKECFDTGKNLQLGLVIPHKAGIILAVEGDMIIKTEAGEIYPMKPEFFNQRYEVVQ